METIRAQTHKVFRENLEKLLEKFPKPEGIRARLGKEMGHSDGSYFSRIADESQKKIDIAEVVFLAGKFGVNPEWLAFGTGPINKAEQMLIEELRKRPEVQQILKTLQEATAKQLGSASDNQTTSIAPTAALPVSEHSKRAPESLPPKEPLASSSQGAPDALKYVKLVSLPASQSESSSTPAHPKAVVRRSKRPKAKQSGRLSPRQGAS